MNNLKIILAFTLIFLSIQIVSADQIFVNTNRYIVLDDPNTGTASAGFPNPNRNWGSTYWTGEPTTIRAIALVTYNNGTPRSGITVTFSIKNPGNTQIGTATNITNLEGIAYYSFDLNSRNYWGNWTIEANITSASNNTPFILNWWGCPSCHGSKSLSTTTHTPKSPYVKGYNFHNDNLAGRHNDTMAAGSCTQCHNTYDYKQDWHTGKVSCQDCHPNSNAQLLNPDIAGCYDTDGCHTKKNSNLDEINTTTGYIQGGNYRTKYSFIPNNATKDHTPGKNVECILCHSPGHNIKKPYNLAGSSNSTTENEQCWNCHTQRTTTHKNNNNCIGCHSQNAHNVTITAAGPDCISCHNITGGSASHRVDAGAMKLGIHANLNSGASSTVNPDNKKCWGCHQSDGSQPTDMGDIYLNPYKCYDCHNGSRVDPNSGLIVAEHFKSGRDIKAATTATDNSTSCIDCHNTTEMKVLYIDNEFTAFSLASHYGKNRSDLRVNGNTICVYCHRNGSTAFSIAMNNPDNKNIVNHSTLSTTPDCTNANCHNSGKIHDSSLTKPVNSNDTYCKTCHTTKSEHKSLYCTECHANNTDGSKAGRDIHGIKYLQKNNSFSTSKLNSTDCTTCHQSSVVDSSLGTFTPEKIGALHHSNNLTNGTRWGNYWNSNNPIEACLYCHNDTRHNLTPLGRPLIWNSSYVMRTTIGSGTNCADCHQKGDNNYLSMKNTFINSGLNIPPDITNGSWNGKPGYFNHSLGDYTDLACKNCHYQGSGSTVGQMTHNVAEGGGGGEPGNYTGNSSNCKGCHPSQYNKWANSTHTSKLITREDAMARGYPNPPGNYSWDNVSFVIGSKWKIRYVNDTGYIITTGGKNQYNIDDQIWTDYNKDIVKKYNCGHCHTTGYIENVSNANKEPFKTLRIQGKIPDGIYNNSLTPGFVGYWAENSIGCESCHGQAGDHINNPSKLNIRNASEVRNSTGICGDCHSRPRSSIYGEYENFKPYPYGVNDSLLNVTLFDDSPMPTVNYSQVGGHHEQWEDWKASGHENVSINCVSCHGGHNVSAPAYAGGPTGKTKFTNGSVYPPASQNCTNCHTIPEWKWVEVSKFADGLPSCEDCHMPLNRKSANKIDLRSHWSNINAFKDNKNGDIHAYNYNILASMNESCRFCHNSTTSNIKPIYFTDIGMHKDVNKSEGFGLLNSSDCKSCHYTSTQTRICENCHIDQAIPSPRVDEHESRGLDVKVFEACSLCHNNSINRYKYTANASIGHYGTINSLINTSECILCHNGPYTGNASWGSPVNISTSTKRQHNETQTSQCDLCHKDNSVPTLATVSFHNASVKLGAGGDDCVSCHGAGGIYPVE